MDNTDIGFCPHCGNDAPQRVEGSCTSDYNTENRKSYVLMQCQTCGGPLIYRRKKRTHIADVYSQQVRLSEFELLWPSPSDLHTCVPEKIRKIYLEASSIKARSPNGFANQIRRALEAVCKDRGATKNNLSQNLKLLATNGEIPERLTDLTDVLRQIGNTGSHAGEDEVQTEYVDAIDDFFRVVIEYVYVAPHKVSQFQARLEFARKTGNQPT